jgi:hypothetical protein
MENLKNAIKNSGMKLTLAHSISDNKACDTACIMCAVQVF